MPSPKLRLLRDESAAVENEITALRALEPKDDADRESIEGRLKAAAERAAKIAAEAQREDDLDAAVASMRGVRSSDKSRDDVEKQFRDAGDKDEFAAPDIRAGVKAFRSTKIAEAAGRYLCSIATGDKRAMGETVSGYGADFVVGELYNAIVNRLQYQSVGVQLASVFRPAGQKITLPKSGDVTFGFAAENAAFTDQDIASSGADLTLYEGGASMPVSRSLVEDSPIDVAGLIVDRCSYGLARWIDTVWLGGNVSNPTIGGLAGAVVAGNTVTVAANASTTANNLADVVGKVDESIMGTGAWVCSKAGYVDLMKIWAAQQTTMVVGGGRVVPTIYGAPVYLVKGLPANTLALFGDFSMATAVGIKDTGLEITVARELLVRSRQLLYVANTRLGVSNHGPEFVGRLAKAST
ncbi:MAG: phage major capsid protein [Planctomycetia bacterium]